VAFETGPNQRLLDLRGGHGWELLVETQLAFADHDGAEETARMAEERARAAGLPQHLVRAACSRAAVRLARGDGAGAVAAAREAIGLATSSANPLLGARAHALLGAGLGQLGEAERGIAELQQAERTFFAFGALREADSAAHELRRLGWRGPRRARDAPRSAMEKLSAREDATAMWRPRCS
jgi:hypothetical protein